MSAAPQLSGKPLTPPPSYSEQPQSAHQHLSPDESAATSSHSPVASPFPLPTHPGYYGPTPIAEQAELLPYYDPRSPHAVAEAAARARWRFITAAIWAVVILTAVSFVTGWEVEAMRTRGSTVERGVYAR